MRKMRGIKLSDVSEQLDNLTEDERRALRGSKFAPLPTRVPNVVKPEPRMPHPGGPVATNKAAALAKFLQRKLETSGSLDLNPALVEAAVVNATATLHGISATNLKIRHVETFSDSEKEVGGAEGPMESNSGQVKSTTKKRKKGKGKNKWKQHATKSSNTSTKGPLKKAKKLGSPEGAIM